MLTVSESGSLNLLEPSGPVISLYRDFVTFPVLFSLTHPKPMIISLLDDSTHDEDDDSGDNDDSPIPHVQHDLSGWMIKYNSCPYMAWKQG